MLTELPAGKAASDERSLWIKRGLLLEWLTIAWMLIEAAVGVFSGVRAHSVTVLAFGIDSIIELCSACVLLWRLDLELRRAREFPESAESLARKIAGALLSALAIYVILMAVWSLVSRAEQAFSLSGLSIALIAIPMMYWLSRSKLRVSAALGSRALRADAVEAIACGWLSFVVVIGLVSQLLLRAWWVDGVTSLVIVYFLIREGREAWTGDCCEED